MKMFIDKLIMLVIMFSVAIFLACVTNLRVSDGQPSNSSDMPGKFNDSAYVIHSVDSPDESNVWFNITAKVFGIHPMNFLPTGNLSIQVYHVGNEKRPMIVYYPAASQNITRLIAKDDCIGITGRTGIPYFGKPTFFADSIKKINCTEMPLLPPVSTVEFYENKFMGLKLRYPYGWHLAKFSGFEDNYCKVTNLNCMLDLKPFIRSFDEFAGIKVIALRGPNFENQCKCTTLLEFVRFRYSYLAQNESIFAFVNDNKTTIGQEKPAWQIEYNDKSIDPPLRTWEIYAIVNGTYYIIDYYADHLSYPKLLPEVKTIIDSLQFIPVYRPKVPSFLQP